MANHAILILQDPAGGETRRWVLDHEVTTIGRWEGNEVSLADREVSRKHAQIRHDGGQYVLVDLGSKNGTLVNGLRAERATALRDGDELVIAPCYRFTFVDSEATVPVDPRPRGVRIDPVSRAVTIGGRPVDPPLAPAQFALLGMLAAEPGRVFTRDEVIAACYPETPEGVSDQAIDGVVRRLRARLAEVDPDREYVVAIRGHGFRMNA